MRGRQRGLTLIEIVVALAIAGLVALAIFGLFRIGFSFHQRSAQAIAAGEAVIGLDVIARTLREAGREGNVFRGWSFKPDEGQFESVAIRTARKRDGFVLGEEGLPQWAGWVGFAYDPIRQAVIRVDFAEGEDIPSPPWGEGRVVARQAENFTVQREADRYVLTLLLKGEGERLTLTTTVWPRNR